MQCCTRDNYIHFPVKTTTVLFSVTLIMRRLGRQLRGCALEGVSFEFFKRGMLYFCRGTLDNTMSIKVKPVCPSVSVWFMVFITALFWSRTYTHIHIKTGTCATKGRIVESPPAFCVMHSVLLPLVGFCLHWRRVSGTSSPLAQMLEQLLWSCSELHSAML